MKPHLLTLQQRKLRPRDVSMFTYRFGQTEGLNSLPAAAVFLNMLLAPTFTQPGAGCSRSSGSALRALFAFGTSQPMCC